MAATQKKTTLGNKPHAGPKRIYETQARPHAFGGRAAGPSAKASTLSDTSYPTDIFGSRAEYDAAMRGVAARIESGEIQRKKPQRD